MLLYVLHLEDSQEDMLLTSSQCSQHTKSVYPKKCSEEQVQKYRSAKYYILVWSKTTFSLLNIIKTCWQQVKKEGETSKLKRGNIGIVQKARGQVWGASVVQSLCLACSVK